MMEGYKALASEMKMYARSRSPTFEGVPTAPTAERVMASKQIATTEYVGKAFEKYVMELGEANYEVVKADG